MASILKFHGAVTATKAVGSTTEVGAIERRNHHILVTTRHIVEDLAGTIAVTSIQRYHDLSPTPRLTKERLGWERQTEGDRRQSGEGYQKTILPVHSLTIATYHGA